MQQLYWDFKTGFNNKLVAFNMNLKTFVRRIRFLYATNMFRFCNNKKYMLWYLDVLVLMEYFNSSNVFVFYTKDSRHEIQSGLSDKSEGLGLDCCELWYEISQKNK